ncbi:PREDICTED: radial spoke head 1 homolog [Acropora digitifera]|uniref:radial spoke head 1 homolog n=1 Tax=Acropora digitifera TaxID=70779 RepID=UPI000779FDF9|nr:PREDICTED: radial spoke head 1 homolog [Acropora digitifera]
MDHKRRWENDERNGQGTYVYKNGDIYEGEWKDNKRHGSGVYTCTSTKLKYDGRWSEGRLSGPAKMILPNHIFLGEFQDNLPEGIGRYVFDFGVEQHGQYILLEKRPSTGDSGQRVEVPVWKCHPEFHVVGSRH